MDTWELMISDSELELRLNSPKHGLIDLVFVDEEEFLSFVAGQHLAKAKALLATLEKD